MNSLNSSDVNWGPLSETNLSGRPCLENRLSNTFVVSLVDIEDDILILAIYCIRRLQLATCDLEMGHNSQYEYVATAQQGIAMNVSHVFSGSFLFN